MTVFSRFILSRCTCAKPITNWPTSIRVCPHYARLPTNGPTNFMRMVVHSKWNN